MIGLLLSPLGRALGLALAIVVAAGAVWEAGVLHERARWDAAVTAQKLEAQGLRLAGEIKARAAEARAAQLGIELEKERNDHAKQLSSVQSDNRGLVADIGRLRDEARRRDRGADRLPDAAAAAGLDPGGAAFGEFLGAVEALAAGSEGFAREADDTALGNILCRAYTLSLPAVMKGPPP